MPFVMAVMAPLKWGEGLMVRILPALTMRPGEESQVTPGWVGRVPEENSNL